MTVRIAERRQAARSAAAWPAAMYDRRGRLVARGRTANISESGVLLLIRWTGDFTLQQVELEMTLPALSAAGRQTRIVRYLCRIARTERLGDMLGLGLSLGRKLR